MAMTQEKIDKMSDNEFISKYIDNNKPKFKISETRHIFENKTANDHLTYHVVFDYVIITNPTFLDDTRYTFKKSIKDNIIFHTKESAEYYLTNAVKPAERQYNPDSSSDTDNKYQYKVYLKTLKPLEEYKYNQYIMYTTYYGVRNFTIHRDYILMLRSDDIKTLMDELYMRYNIVVDQTLVETVNINSLFNIKNDDIEKLKKQYANSNNERTSIVINEIERTQQYLELLKKLLD